VAPLADAMRFVDREHRNADLAKQWSERAAIESLGSDVQELDLLLLHAAHALRDLGGRESAVLERRGDSSALERIDLILHQ
jgi:hypothetical protein